MRIDVVSEYNDHYVRAIFKFEKTIVDSGLLNEKDCLVLAEHLRMGADSLEHYSRVIADTKKQKESS
jgi:hypothetical protein